MKKPEFLHNTETGGLFKVPNDYEITTNEMMNSKIRGKTNKTYYKIPKKNLDKYKNREDGNYYVADINPDDFLKITSNDKLIKDIEQETKALGDLDIKKLNTGNTLLEVDLESGKVISHEGRHRMQLLKNNGYNKAQVIIMSKSNVYDKSRAHNFNSLHLKHQMDDVDFETSVIDLKILNKKE